MFWSLLQNIGNKGIQFVVMLILARLLTPEAFGLIGMLMIFIQVSQTLVQAGFSQALIQKKDTDEEDYSSVFWINLVISIALYLILYVSAPLIAHFYDQPQLTNLARGFAFVFIINAFSYVQDARLTKQMRFKTLTIIQIPSTVIGAIVSITMAYLGYGVWSIIALQLATRLVYAIQIWIYAKWKPLLQFNKKKATDLFNFGSKLMFSGILHTVFQNIYLVIIGKYFPLSSVGYYQNADNLVKTPSKTLTSALSKVTFPALSSVQDDDIRLKIGYKKVIQQILFWLCPLFLLAAIFAEPLFRFVLTEKWLPAVLYFQILCVVGIFLPLNSFNLNILNVKGRSDIFLKLEIIKKTIIVVGIIISIPLGIKALLYFQAANAVAMYCLNAGVSGRYIRYNLMEQIKDIVPVLFINAIIGLLMYFIDLTVLIKLSDFLRIVCGFGLGFFIYLFIARLFKFEAYAEFNDIFRNKVLNYLKRK